MKVQMLIRISGTRNGEDWPAVGGVVDVTRREAERLIAAKFAKPVEAEPKKAAPVIERAVAPKAETRKGGLTKGNTGL